MFSEEICVSGGQSRGGEVALISPPQLDRPSELVEVAKILIRTPKLLKWSLSAGGCKRYLLEVAPERERGVHFYSIGWFGFGERVKREGVLISAVQYTFKRLRYNVQVPCRLGHLMIPKIVSQYNT